MGKSSNVNIQYECNPNSIKMVGKALGSSKDTVNPYSIRKNGKNLTNGKSA